MLVGTTIGDRQERKYPKLMANDNVVALFTDAKYAVVVVELSPEAIPVGQRLHPETCNMDLFYDFNGVVELKNH